MRRLLLVRHASTPAVRSAAFAADEDLDAAGARDAPRLGGALPSSCEPISSPERRCLQTAQAAGLKPAVEPMLAECDCGAWTGLTPEQVQARFPGELEGWMSDPDARAHGGESLSAFAARVRRWLERQAEGDGFAAVITHAGVIRAAVMYALGAPWPAFWRVDIAPLAITELHSRSGGWRVTRVNCIVSAQRAISPETAND